MNVQEHDQRRDQVTRERAFSYLTDDLRRSMDALFAMLESDR